MCGIVGIISHQQYRHKNIKRMVESLNHRGPDDTGIWQDLDAGISLGHKRLSIIDLSREGHQPIFSSSRRYVLIYNGEIYNFKTIRKSLEKEFNAKFRGYSDSEVLVESIECWGLEKTLRECVGMFAFALWDTQEHCLTLARDRFGEKPLYYGWVGDTFVFSSELKALKLLPGWRGDIDRQALLQYMRYGCVPAPYSIYKNINKIKPGTFIILSQTDKLEQKTFWSPDDVVAQSIQTPFSGSYTDAINTLERHLQCAIEGQMLSDVPLGALLSGGIDSSLIVSLMQKQSSKPIRTFSIGFNEAGYNEAKIARDVARHLGTEHTELYVTSQDCLNVVPKLSSLYDEPFADSSQIPTYLVSMLARQEVSVALTGDGGDELFCGYYRYFLGYKLWGRLRYFPFPLRVLMGMVLNIPSGAVYRQVERIFNSKYSNFQGKLVKLINILRRARRQDELHRSLTSVIHEPEKFVLDEIEELAIFNTNRELIRQYGFVEGMMLADTINYMPNDILTKVDRASMGVSLETRIPFLDHRVFEFAWQLPLQYKCNHSVGKVILRELLSRFIPSSLIETPKRGFAIPLADWLRGPLRDWASSLLEDQNIRQQGYLSHSMIKKYWAEHLSGQCNWSHALWNILMFQCWLNDI